MGFTWKLPCSCFVTSQCHCEAGNMSRMPGYVKLTMTSERALAAKHLHGLHLNQTWTFSAYNLYSPTIFKQNLDWSLKNVIWKLILAFLVPKFDRVTAAKQHWWKVILKSFSSECWSICPWWLRFSSHWNIDNSWTDLCDVVVKMLRCYSIVSDRWTKETNLSPQALVDSHWGLDVDSPFHHI